MPEQTEILITRNPDGTGCFPAVECTQSQLVYWRNGDRTSPHWPFFPDQPGVGPRFQVGSGDTSDPVQPYANTTAISPGQNQVVNYSCKVSGHEAEQGMVTVWPDFLVVQFAGASGTYYEIDGTSGTQFKPIALTSGGKAPYSHTITDATLPKGVAVTDGAAGVTVTGTPSDTGSNFAVTVHAKDALGNRVDQTFTFVIQSGAIAST